MFGFRLAVTLVSMTMLSACQGRLPTTPMATGWNLASDEWPLYSMRATESTAAGQAPSKQLLSNGLRVWPVRVSASSERTLNFPVHFAADGHARSAWAPALYEPAPWLQMDAGRTIPLASISLKLSRTRADIEVRVSVDRVTWTSLVTGLSPMRGGSARVTEGQLEARYVRFVFRAPELEDLSDLYVCEVAAQVSDAWAARDAEGLEPDSPVHDALTKARAASERRGGSIVSVPAAGGSGTSSWAEGAGSAGGNGTATGGGSTPDAGTGAEAGSGVGAGDAAGAATGSGAGAGSGTDSGTGTGAGTGSGGDGGTGTGDGSGAGTGDDAGAGAGDGSDSGTGDDAGSGAGAGTGTGSGTGSGSGSGTGSGGGAGTGGTGLIITLDAEASVGGDTVADVGAIVTAGSGGGSTTTTTSGSASTSGAGGASTGVGVGVGVGVGGF